MSDLRERREEARLTLQDVADAIGVKKQTVGQWELQGCKPSDENLKMLEKVLADPDHYRKHKYVMWITTEDMRMLLEKAPELKNYINGLVR